MFFAQRVGVWSAALGEEVTMCFGLRWGCGGRGGLSSNGRFMTLLHNAMLCVLSVLSGKAFRCK